MNMADLLERLPIISIKDLKVGASQARNKFSILVEDRDISDYQIRVNAQNFVVLILVKSCQHAWERTVSWERSQTYCQRDYYSCSTEVHKGLIVRDE